MTMLEFVLLLCLLLLVYALCSPRPVALLVCFLFRRSPEREPEDFPQLEAQVRCQRDIDYRSAHKGGTLDLYLPQRSTAPLPLIVWIHGGAFVASDKRDVRIYATMLAAQGYAVAAINYALAPDGVYPCALLQTGEAIAFLRGHAAQYGLDISRLVLAGDSAGASYAAQFYLAQRSAKFAALAQVEPSVAPAQIAALLLYCGPYDVPAVLSRMQQRRILGYFSGKIGHALFGTRRWQQDVRLKSFSILDYADTPFPPCFITDGNQGSFQAQGQALAQELIAQGNPVDTLFFSREEFITEHEYQFKLDTPAADICRNRTLSFLQENLSIYIAGQA